MKVLIIGLNWLGDIVMSLPAVAAVAKKYDTHVVTRPHLEEVYHLSGLDIKVHPIKTKEFFFNLFKQTSGLRALNFDYAIALPQSLRAAIVAKMCLPQKSIGYKAQFREIFLDFNVNLPKNFKEIHEAKLYAALLKEIGIAEVDLIFKPKPFEETFKDKLFHKLSLEKNLPYTVVAPGAAFGAAKRWPAKKFAEFIKLIHKNEPQMQVLLTAAANEASIVEEIENSLDKKPISAVGKTSITELGCLLQGASLLAANDSGTMHLGALYKVPTVVPVGPTDMQRTGALNTKFKPIIADNCHLIPCRKRECPTKNHICMESITPEVVYEASLEVRR